jgi:hypothetical protein
LTKLRFPERLGYFVLAFAERGRSHQVIYAHFVFVFFFLLHFVLVNCVKWVAEMCVFFFKRLQNVET